MSVMVACTYVMTTVMVCLLTMKGSQSQSISNDHNRTTASTVMPWSGGVPSQPNDSSESDAEESEEYDYPNPRQNPDGCSREAPSWLCDEDAVLDAKSASVLEESLESLREANGICPCQNSSCSYSGLPMVVVVLKTVQLNNSQFLTKKQRVLALAEDFLNNWKFDTCQDGAVTVVSANEGIVVTFVGEASRPLVSIDCQKSVENATSDFFSEGLIHKGLEELIDQYRLIILKKHACNNVDHLRMRVVIPIIVIVAGITVCAIIAGVLVYRRRGSRDIKTDASVPLKDEQRPERV